MIWPSRKQPGQGGVLMEVVMPGPTLAMFSPTAWQLSLLVYDVLIWGESRINALWKVEAGRELWCVLGLLRKQGESADMSLASQGCVWAIKSYLSLTAFLSRFPWLPISPILISDEELKYDGDKLLINTKQTGRSASFQHIILHDILSVSTVKAGKTSSYIGTNQLSHAVDTDDSVHSKRRISSLRNQKWHAVWCISVTIWKNR